MSQITIIDRQTDKVLDDIQMDEFWDELRTRDLNGLDIFDFVTFADKVFSQYLKGERGLIIPAREGGYAEFIIKENKQTRDRNRYIFAEGSFLEIAKKKIIEPGTYTGTPQQLIQLTMNGIAKWKIGNVAYATIRTIQVDERITAYQMLKRIAKAFEYELKFRVENTKGEIDRYIDLVEKIGAYRGHEIELGHNLESIERHENTRDIVTALNVYGPPDENGIRKHVFVYDNEALERWSTDGEHLVEDYYPETLDQDITDERLITLGENELEKRVNALVSYTAKMVDIGEKVQFGDQVKVKDEKFNPPLYLEGRIHTLREDLKGIIPADVDFGSFVELTVEEAFANYRKLQEEMQKKINLAEQRAAIGDIKFTIISYVEPLNVEKSSLDSRFDSLNNNLDLSDTIRSSLVNAKTNYNNAYNVLMNTINTKKALDELTEADLQEVNSQYASYDMELSNLTEQFELATNDIAQKKANDAEGKAKKHTDDSLVSVNEALSKAQSDIEQALIDLGTAQTDIETAQGTIDSAITDLGDLETALNDIEIGGRNLYVQLTEEKDVILLDSGPANNLGFNTSDYIPVSAGEQYVFNKYTEEDYHRIGYFDVNKVFVNRELSTDKVVTLTIPNGVAYIRASMRTNVMDRYKIEKGNMATDWTPAPEDKLDIGQAANDINNGATRILGKNIIIDGDALVTGTIGASAATFLNMTTRDMTAINATMQNSTVTGNLTATNATFLNGTFDSATIIDATIENATITGNMIAGTISSSTKIDVTTDLFVGNNIYLGNDDLVGRKVIDFFDGRSFISSDYINIGGQVRNRIAIAAEGTRGFVTIAGSDIELIGTNVISFTGQSSTASIDITGGLARWRQSAENYIRQGTDGTIDFYKESSLLARFTTMETAKHGFLRMGGIGLKFLNSGDNFQVRNNDDTAYAALRALSVTEMSSEKWKTNIQRYENSALELINKSVIYQYVKGNKPEIGLIIERETPFEVVDGEGVRGYIMGSLAWKAIQELDESTNRRITNLEVENKMLKERVRQLEVKVA